MVRGNLQESLDNLRSQFIDLMSTVDQQIESGMDAWFNKNIEMAELVDEKEKTVNKKELLIDKECEKNLALYGPVANDLRFILSVVEMNTHLERIGDIMQTISLNVIETPEICSKELLEKMNVLALFGALSETYKEAVECFTEENIDKASHLFITNRHVKKDIKKTKPILVNLIKNNPKNGQIYLNLHTNMRMLIRFGDMIDNLMEEIVFYREAVVLKHKKKKHKKVRKIIAPPENDQTGDNIESSSSKKEITGDQ